MASSITVSINRNDVYTEVGRMTAYLGQHRSTAEDASAFERIELTDSDKSLLAHYWDEAKDALCLRLQRYVATATDAKSTDDGLTLTLTASDRFNVAMTESLPGSVKSYMASYIMLRWCSVAATDETEYYGSLAAGFMAEILAKLCAKTRPVRKSPTKGEAKDNTKSE